MAIQPYSLNQAQELVKDAVKRSDRRHAVWQGLELLYRRGEVHDSLSQGDVPSVIWEEFPGLTLDSINIVLPNTQIIIAQALAHDPAFLVEPYTGGEDAEQEAKFGEQLLRYFWKRVHGTDVHRSMLQDMVVMGSGFCKIGWAYLEELVDRDEDELAEELIRLQEVERKDAILLERDERDLDELSEALQVNHRHVVQDEPFVEYVSPYDILVPRHATRIEDCRWIAQRVILPVDELRANELLDEEALDHLVFSDEETDRPGMRPGEEDSTEGGAGGEQDGDDPFLEATVFEFYDMRSRRMMIFQENAAKPLLDTELPYSHRHPPFVHMRNMEDGRRFWPFGDLENVASIQEEFNQYVFEQMSSARRSGNKYVIDKRVYSTELKKLLESEQPDVVAPLDLGGRPMADVIQRLEREPMPAEVFQAKHDLADAMRDVLGINEFQAGGVGADRMAATTAAVVDGNATLRAADKKWQVERAAAETGLRMLLLCQEFLDEELALRIVGAHGNVEWLNVSKEDLSGEFGVSVTSGSTMAVNPATRTARALDVMTQIIPALAEDGYDTHPFWRQALRDYGMDPDRMLQRLPMPEQGGAPGGGAPGELPPGPTVPQEEMGGPPVPAAVEGDLAL